MKTHRHLCLAACLVLVGCDKHEFHPPSRDQQVAQADSLLTPETFDTIAWPSDSARAFEGNNTFAAHCRQCHGFDGRGGTEYAREHDLEPPSLARDDWPYKDLDAVRRRIFVGHPEGMPTWGISRISPREIDAAAYYIVHVLRPEAAR
jgi:mono/diheme cytochrome c family protein